MWSVRCQWYFQMGCPIGLGYIALELSREVGAGDRDVGIIQEEDMT